MPMIAKCASSRSRSVASGKSMKVVKTARGGTVRDDMVVLLNDRWRRRFHDESYRGESLLPLLVAAATSRRRKHRMSSWGVPGLPDASHHASATGLSQQAGQQVDAERQDDGVEEEGHDAVTEGQAAHEAAGDLHVGDLAGHADDKGEIEEVPVVAVLLAGKGEAAGYRRRVLRGRAFVIEGMRVVDGEEQ